MEWGEGLRRKAHNILICEARNRRIRRANIDFENPANLAHAPGAGGQDRLKS